jgi:uncharacterized protein YbjT (DUF2867 family)
MLACSRRSGHALQPTARVACKAPDTASKLYAPPHPSAMEPLPPQRRILIAGATGLVGTDLLRAALDEVSISQVHALSRRELNLQHPKLRVHVVDFENLPDLPKVDETYLALGTTIKVAGSQDAFRAVDLHANLCVANAARQAGCQRVGLVSAVGADSRSSVFYNRVKGELESALKQLPLQALVIAQPSLLLGNRQALQQAPRAGERLLMPIAKCLAPVLPGKYRPVSSQAVARSLLKTLPGAHGHLTLTSAQLAAIGSMN